MPQTTKCIQESRTCFHLLIANCVISISIFCWFFAHYAQDASNRLSEVQLNLIQMKLFAFEKWKSLFQGYTKQLNLSVTQHFQLVSKIWIYYNVWCLCNSTTMYWNKFPPTERRRCYIFKWGRWFIRKTCFLLHLQACTDENPGLKCLAIERFFWRVFKDFV